MKTKIKKYISDNRQEILEAAILTTVAITTWTLTCRAFGYEMAKPCCYDQETKNVHMKCLLRKDAVIKQSPDQ